MNNHFITEIYIDKIRHLENITINLNYNKSKHLLLTGKNGSGKTTTLQSIKKYLRGIQLEKLISVNHYRKNQIKVLTQKIENEENEDNRIQLENEMV